MKKSKLKKYYDELWHQHRRTPDAVIKIEEVLNRLEEIKADSKERKSKMEEVAP